MKAVLIALLGVLPVLAGTGTFHADVPDAQSWTKILSAIGLAPDKTNAAILVVPGDSTKDVVKLAEDHVVIVEGFGTAAERVGVRPSTEAITVRHIVDTHAPDTQIVWEQPVQVPKAVVESDMTVFAKERWSGSPVLVGKRTSHGAVLWTPTPPGPNGYERYPYLLQALCSLGVSTPVRGTNLWAFFDSAYRIRADVDYLAHRWRQCGISVLHVAAWHNMERDPVQDAYLTKLIDACHRNDILVYAWFELPHVSDTFWNQHPEWREKTASGQDAELDWRKLMNLQNPDCERAVRQQVEELMQRFDWDGVNFAELYFESLEGAENPARFTPMNDDVRAEYKTMTGIDPKTLFGPAHSASDLRRFLDFRAILADRMQSDWLKEAQELRKSKPYLGIAMTHIDDRFDHSMRDALGADVTRVLPLMRAAGAKLLVEDPATLWNLGPERYAKLATEYSGTNAAIDINVVDRYQDVYPTKKQTGVELFELVHQAAVSFHQVALYFENSLNTVDLPLLAVAASGARVSEPSPDEVSVESQNAVRIAWQGPAEVDGMPWPVHDGTTLLIPAGKHVIRTGLQEAPALVTDFNGEMKSPKVDAGGLEFSYSQATRALLQPTDASLHIEVDGASVPNNGEALQLPAGQHFVSLKRASGT